MRFFKRSNSGAQIDPAILLDRPAKPIQRLAPVDAPPNADEATRRFFEASEWLQPYLNLACAPNGFTFEESDETTLVLPYGPVTGRNFDLFCNAAPVGKVSVYPCLFEDLGWAELRVRLVYPVEQLLGEEVHSLLTSLVRSTGRYIENEQDFLATSASALASKAMTIAMWDKLPGSRLVVECSTQGPWDLFWSTVERWKLQEVDPWKKWECTRSALGMAAAER